MTLLNLKHTNNARALQLGSISAGAVSVICATGYGDLFPTTFPFLMTIENFVNATGLVSKREIVRVTNRVGDTFTIVRSAGSCPASSTAITQTNTAFSFTPDADNTVVLSHKLTAEDLNDINNELVRIVGTEIPAKVSKTGDNMTGLFKEAQGADIASATTTDLSVATGNFVKITGTTTITGFGTVQAGTCMKIEFTGILTLTYNATSMRLPNAGANITTANGDSAVIESLGSGNWKFISYTKADGTALVASSPSYATTSSSGLVQLATDAVAEAGASTTLVPTASQLDKYSVSTSLRADYLTWPIPMLATSASVLNGWEISGINHFAPTTNPTAGGYSDVGPSTGAGYISTKLPGHGTTSEYTMSANKILRIKFNLRLNNTGNTQGWGFCASGSPANIYVTWDTTTNGNARFVLSGTTLYAETSNATDAESTDITSGITVTNKNLYEIVINGTTSVQYYIGGVLKATHSTRIPTGALVFAVGASALKNIFLHGVPVISMQL